MDAGDYCEDCGESCDKAVEFPVEGASTAKCPECIEKYCDEFAAACFALGQPLKVGGK